MILKRVKLMTLPHGCMHTLRHVYLLTLHAAEQIMGMPALESRVWTLEEFETARDAAPQGERWEYIDGSVYVTPSPLRRHEIISMNLIRILDPYVLRSRVGVALTAPLDTHLRKTRILQPDVLVLPPSERDCDYPIRLLLAAEIISPSSARTDCIVKRPVYQSARVSEYWIVDDDAKIIERWQPDDERPSIIADRFTWHPDGAAEPLLVELADVFRDPFADL